MKLKPLKGKLRDLFKENNYNWACKQDIKSAVEWLKGQFKTMSIEERSNNACVDNIIDKAFEDVTDTSGGKT